MSSEVGYGFNLAAKICVRVTGDIINSVFGSFAVWVISEFVGISAALKAEMAKQLKRCVLAYNRYVEFAGAFYHFAGLV